jgi:CRISPR-associated protein Cas1
MAWRGLHLTQASRLSLRGGQMHIVLSDGEISLPLEDIAYLVLDTPETTLSAPLMSAAMDAGIALIVTDEKHLPSGVMVPFHRHFRQAGMLQLQIAQTLPFRKRVWQAIVQAKIDNQADLLRMAGHDCSHLRALSRLVSSGDTSNVEARAARAYWRTLWTEFRREDESDRRNAMLNYGYAIVRACVARALVAVGFIPALGIHHASVTNSFNLADDLMEPFRPFVDFIVLQNPGVGELTLQDRQSLAAVMMSDARVGGEVTTVLAAVEMVTSSLVRAMESKSIGQLRLPSLSGVRLR